jgi:hypothetical protein
MKKVVYLIDQPFDERNYQRFGIGLWLQHGWAVEVWDLTPWAHPDVWRNFLEQGNQPRAFPGYRAVTSRRLLALHLGACGHVSYFIDLAGDSYRSIWAKISLQRAGVSRIVCAVGTIPVPDRVPVGALRKLAQVLAKGPKGAFKWLASAVMQRLVVPRIATGVAVVSGEQSMAGLGSCGTVIRAHNFDYDSYLSLRKSSRPAAADYAVFIDQDYCFHIEYIYQSIRPIVTPQSYFPAVRRGLELISAQLAVEVRIAAHPRATYEQRNLDCFGEFPLEYGRTAELIRDCQFVVCHDSTAIQFAVLFEKPMIFVTTAELNLAYEGRSIAKVAAEFGKSPIDLDRPDLRDVDWKRELSVDAARYAAYRNRYVKTHASPEQPLWDIVIKRIDVEEVQVA